MEKKSIGKFISVLRRANGMTQKELGEKLFVSDKTVSRWECDECTPDLSLLPAIAEIFGITTDELIRGERNNQEKENISKDYIDRQKNKSDKQFSLILERKSRKYKNLTLVSVGISILGLIITMMVNLGFAKGFIAFCLGILCFLTSEICQICFALNSRIIPYEDENDYIDKIQLTNNLVIRYATIVSFLNLGLFAFCLPLIIFISSPNYGLVFEYWLMYGVIITFIVLIIAYCVYLFFIRKVLVKRGLITLTEKQNEQDKKSKKLFIETFSISSGIAILLGISIFILNSIGSAPYIKELVFYNCSDFKVFMENDYDNWYLSNFNYVYKIGDDIKESNLVIDEEKKEIIYPNKVNKGIYNSNGELICVYYFNPDLYYSIQFTETADDKMPAKVITMDALNDAKKTLKTIESILYAFIGVDMFGGTAIYFVKTYIDKQKN